MKRSVLIVAVLISALAFLSFKTSAQAPAANDVNGALVRELHELRLAIEKLASANSRVQVLSARVTQQEQRISSLTMELLAQNNKLAEASANTALKNSTLEQAKDRARLESDPVQRSVLAAQQQELAADLEHDRLIQSSLQVQAEALRRQILAEQSSLAELQRRLDELMR